MKTALVLRDSDFSNNNIGKVTLIKDDSLKELGIQSEEQYTARTISSITVIYTPEYTSDKSVTWSITAGTEYASIDSSTGKITVLETANSSSITIKVSSVNNPDIYATKTILITYQTNIEITGISINGSDTVKGSATYTITYEPSDTTYNKVTWSITSGSDYASINSETGELTAKETADSSSVKIKAVSTHNENIYAEKDITVSYKVDVLTGISVEETTGTVILNTKYYKAVFTPTNTSYNAVTWSITSGTEYASIDSSSGTLTVIEGASSSSVTIRATSTHDNTIYGEKTESFTYVSEYDLRGNAMYIKLPDTLKANSTLYYKFKNNISTDALNSMQYTGMLISTRDPKLAGGGAGHWQIGRSTSASPSNFTTIFSAVDTSSNKQSGVSRYNYSINYTSNNVSEMLISSGIIKYPLSLSYTKDSKTVLPYTGYLYVNMGSNTSTGHSPQEYSTGELLKQAIYSGTTASDLSTNLRNDAGTEKIIIENLLVFKEQSFESVDSMMNASLSADIRLSYDSNFKPINIGTTTEQFIYT